MTITATKPPERVRFGIEGLDEVLMGGLMRHNNVLIEGPPGGGKTTLALAFAYGGAALFDEPALVVSFELTPAKMLQDAHGFGWDFDRLERENKLKLIQTSPLVLLDDLRVEDGVLASELRSIGAKRLVIDGLTPLRLFIEQSTAATFRESLHLLVEGLTRFGVTTLVTRELDTAMPARDAHERYLFDTIITLDRTQRHRTMHRSLEVIKSRGQDFIPGEHTLRLEAGVGAAVYRRTQSRPKNDQPQPASTERNSIGSAALDELFGGGLLSGSITMFAGISGTGKTVAGVQFLTAGAATGHRGLMVSLDEQPQQLCRNAASVNLPLERLLHERKLHLLYDSPLELELDVHFDRIVKLVEQESIDRIVFDSLAVYQRTNPDEAADFLYALASFCKGRLATVIYNYESPELLGISQISENLRGSHLVDNIVLLNYVEVSTTLRRAITVPKARGSKNVQVTREYVIGDGGLSLLSEDDGKAGEMQAVPQLPFSSYYGLLARAPARRSPVIDEAVISGQPLPDSPTMTEE